MHSSAWASAVKKTLLYAQAFEAKRYVRRKRFLKNQYKAQQAKLPIIYLDETGFAPSTCRQWGRAPVGKRVRGTHNADLRPRTSLIGGYANNRLIAPMLFDGTCNTEVFNQWLEHMLLPNLLVGSVLVLDNATFHQSARTREIVEQAGCTLLFLAPYSPDLNPIEKCWANLKRAWRNSCHLTLDQLINTCMFRSSYK